MNDGVLKIIYVSNDLESIMKAADRALYEVKDKQINFKLFEDSQFPLPES